MNREETHNVLTYLVTAGKVQPLDGQAGVWHDALAGIRYEDAIAACRAVAASDKTWVTPGTVQAEVRRIRRERIGNATPPPPPPDVTDPRAQIAYQRAWYAAVGDGQAPEAADAAACAQIGAQRLAEVETRRPVSALLEGAVRHA